MVKDCGLFLTSSITTTIRLLHVLLLLEMYEVGNLRACPGWLNLPECEKYWHVYVYIIFCQKKKLQFYFFENANFTRQTGQVIYDFHSPDRREKAILVDYSTLKRSR